MGEIHNPSPVITHLPPSRWAGGLISFRSVLTFSPMFIHSHNRNPYTSTVSGQADLEIMDLMVEANLNNLHTFRPKQLNNVTDATRTQIRIFTMLSTNTSIREVDLSWICIQENERTLNLLCQAIETNHSLRTLDLRGCLSTAGKLQVAQSIGKNVGLEDVQLWYFKSWFLSDEEKKARELLVKRFPTI